MARPTFRFKLSSEVSRLLDAYASVKDREPWEQFVNDNKKIIETECERLVSMGYQGDPLFKMLRSVKYYRNGGAHKKNSKSSTERRDYIAASDDLREDIVSHIENVCFSSRLDFPMKPAYGFADFEQHYVCLIGEELNRLMVAGLNESEAYLKIKKTYKNHYFQISKQRCKKNDI